MVLKSALIKRIARRHPTRFVWCLCAVLLTLFAVTQIILPVQAEQNESAQQFWLDQAKRKVTAHLPSRTRSAAPLHTQTAQALKPIARSVPEGLDPSVNVLAVLGDALADDLARGLQQNFATRGDIFVVAKSMIGQGLVASGMPDGNGQNNANKSVDFADFAKQIADGKERISVALISIGLRDLGFGSKDISNKDESNKDDPKLTSKGFERFSNEWHGQYKAKVDAVMLAFTAHKIPVIWVGLPQGLDDGQMALVTKLNGITQERVNQFGGHFIDARALFANDEARVDVYGTGIDGRRAKLWHDDRLMLSNAGARKLALLTEHDLRQALAVVPAPEFAALPPDIGAPKADIDALFRKDDGAKVDSARLEDKSPNPDKEKDFQENFQENLPEVRPRFETVTLSAVQSAPLPLNAGQPVTDKSLFHPDFKQNHESAIDKDNSRPNVALGGDVVKLGIALKEDVAAALLVGKPITPRAGRLDETSLAKP